MQLLLCYLKKAWDVKLPNALPKRVHSNSHKWEKPPTIQGNKQESFFDLLMGWNHTPFLPWGPKLKENFHNSKGLFALFSFLFFFFLVQGNDLFTSFITYRFQIWLPMKKVIITKNKRHGECKRTNHAPEKHCISFKRFYT